MNTKIVSYIIKQNSVLRRMITWICHRQISEISKMCFFTFHVPFKSHLGQGIKPLLLVKLTLLATEIDTASLEVFGNIYQY